MFPAYNGPDTGYVAANYNVVTGQNNIDSWLVFPVIPGGVRQGDSLYFYSRSTLNSTYPDSIRVMYSASDTVPEGSWIELGRFQASIDGNWEFRGFEAPITAAKGRFAIRYCVINGGPSGSNSNYIGIDAISVVTHQDSLELIGSTNEGNYAGAPRMRGNFFLCDVNTIVKEYRWYLDPADTANIWFTIYEGDSAGGTFNRIFSREVRTPDTAVGWFTTGPMDARMEAGKYYFYAMVWDASVSVRYYRGAGLTYPYPYSFGDLVGLCGLGGYPSGTPVTPPQDTLEVPAGAFSGNMAYYQALVTVPEVLPSVSADSMYFKAFSGTALMAGDKSANPAPVNRTSMSFQYDQTVPCMDPWGYYVYEVYGTNLRRFQVDDGSYVDMALAHSGDIACGTDGQYIYVPNDSSVHKYTMAGVYSGTTTLDISADPYAFAVVNDTVWASPNRDDHVFYAYPTSAFAGGTITNATTWDVGGGTPCTGNIAFDGTYYYVPWIGTTSTTYKIFSLNRALLSTGIAAGIDVRSVMCRRNPYTGVAGGPGEQTASRLMLGANYPNPFRTSTSIEFALPKAGRASLKVYNVLGQQVATLVDGNLPAGKHHASWSARSVANGVYLYRLEANGQQVTRKLAVVR